MWNFSKNSEQPKTLIEVERKRKKYLGADGGVVSFHHCWRRRRRRRRQGFKYHISMMIVCAVGTTCETHFFFFFFFVWIPRKLHWFGFWCRWESWNTTWEAERERETQSKSFSELTRASLNSRPGYIFGFWWASTGLGYVLDLVENSK